MMKTVLGIFVTMPVGGAENFWLNTLQKLDRERFHPITCCISDKGTIGERAERLGFEVVALGRMQGKGFDAYAVGAISRLIKARSVDIVHTNMYHASLYGRLAALTVRPRPKVVMSVHNVYSTIKTHRLLINWILIGCTDRVIAASEKVRADIRRYDKAPDPAISVIPYGVDVESFSPALTKKEARRMLRLEDDEFVIGNVGRLVEAKGQSDLLKACAEVKKTGSKFKVLIIGSGRLDESLREEATRLGIEDEAVFTGERQDLPELFRAMDVYVMSSLWEGSPLALISAMSAGLPCVVTSVGGMPELVDYGKAGIQLPPGHPSVMADALLRLHRDKEMMARLGREAKARAREHYGSEAMTRRVEALYESLF